jgi:hypothetical protein
LCGFQAWKSARDQLLYAQRNSNTPQQNCPCTAQTSACFHYSKELPTASQGVGLAPLLSLCLNAVKRGQLTCDFRCTGLANRRSRSLQALKSSGIHEIYSI